MRNLLETLVVSFSMYSALPMPAVDWNEQNMKYALCAFPLVGAVLALLLWGWTALCGRLAFPGLLRGAGFCLLPVVLTGGIHLDGLADTSDALASYASPEHRQEILADPHCGAFAVIRLCAWFVGYFALCCALSPTPAALLCWGLSFVLSRALSGYAVAAFPLARSTGLAHTFASTAHKAAVRSILAVAAAGCALGLILAGGLSGLFMVLSAALVLAHYRRTAMKQFGGISGDLAGWFLQRAEFWMLAALVLGQHTEALL